MGKKEILEWQKVAGVTADGDFGPVTLKRSLEIAGKAGLTVDKKPEPLAAAPTPNLTARELDMDPELRRRWLIAKERWNKGGNRPVICTCSYRSPAEQEALYAQGRTRSGRWSPTPGRGSRSTTIARPWPWMWHF